MVHLETQNNLFKYTPEQISIVKQLKDLAHIHVPDLLELVGACRDNSINPTKFDSSTIKNLRNRGLLNETDQIPEPVKRIVLCAVDGDDFTNVRIRPSTEWLKI